MPTKKHINDQAIREFALEISRSFVPRVLAKYTWLQVKEEVCEVRVHFYKKDLPTLRITIYLTDDLPAYATFEVARKSYLVPNPKFVIVEDQSE